MESTDTTTKMAFTNKGHGIYEARFTAEREIYRSSDGECVLYTTDSITFRVCKLTEYSTGGRYQEKTTGYRTIVFVNGEILADDHGRNLDRLEMAKAYLRRLAQTDELQRKALAAWGGAKIGHDIYRIDTHHDAYMAALDDYYGARR